MGNALQEAGEAIGRSSSTMIFRFKEVVNIPFRKRNSFAKVILIDKYKSDPALKHTH